VLEDIDSPVSFAPDGARFAFVRFSKSEGVYSLMVANADGTGAYALATKGAGQNLSVDGPAWSPDGKLIAFERGGYVWTMTADGHRATRVAKGTQPAWQPLP